MFMELLPAGTISRFFQKFQKEKPPYVAIAVLPKDPKQCVHVWYEKDAQTGDSHVRRCTDAARTGWVCDFHAKWIFNRSRPQPRDSEAELTEGIILRDQRALRCVELEGEFVRTVKGVSMGWDADAIKVQEVLEP